MCPTDLVAANKFKILHRQRNTRICQHRQQAGAVRHKFLSLFCNQVNRLDTIAYLQVYPPTKLNQAVLNDFVRVGSGERWLFNVLHRDPQPPRGLY